MRRDSETVRQRDSERARERESETVRRPESDKTNIETGKKRVSERMQPGNG